MRNIIGFLLLFFPVTLSAQVYNVMTYNTENEITYGLKIKTQIPVSANAMPTVHIEGYELNIGPINLDIGWYSEGSTIVWASASSAGAFSPTITLSVVSGKIHIHMGGAGGYAYAPRFAITAFAQGLDETASMFTGWTVADEALGGSNQTGAYTYNFFQQMSGINATTNILICNGQMAVGNKSVIGSTAATDAKEMLQVNGSVTVNGNSNGYKFNAYTAGSSSYYSTTGYAGTVKLDTAGRFLFTNTATSGAAGSTATLTNKLAITKDGKTGVGTIDPKELLHVNGNITLGGNNTGYRFNTYNNGGTKYVSSGYGAAFTLGTDGTLLYSNTSSSGAADGSATLNNAFAIDKNGTVYAKKVKVTQTTWADDVFEKEYKLMSLPELEAYIKKYQHLPGVASTAEVEKHGTDVAEIQATLLRKIEELTLYVIELQKQVEKLKQSSKK